MDISNFEQSHKIAIIGGTGAVGKGLAYRWYKAGLTLIIGSREKSKALTVVTELQDKLSNKYRKQKETITGESNEAAASQAKIIVIAVPFSQHKKVIESIAPYAENKIIIDVTVALNPPEVFRVQIPSGQSAGMLTQQLLGPKVKVVSAFQNVAASTLMTDKDIHCDVLVTGNDIFSCEQVIALANVAKLNAFYAGPIDNSIATEAMTSILIQLNKHYQVHNAGLKVTGLSVYDNSEVKELTRNT